MSGLGWATLLAFALLVLFTWLSRRRYGTLLNPFPLFGLYQLLHIICVPLGFHALGMQPVDDGTYVQASLISSLYMGAVGLGFILEPSPFKGIMSGLASLFPGVQAKVDNRRAVLLVNTGLFILIYGALMKFSGAGLTWITNPRMAYQFNRAGVGVLWALAGATLLSSLMFFLTAFKPRGGKLLAGVLLHMAASYFLGAKTMVVSCLLFTLFYYNFCVRRLKDVIIAALGTVGVLVGIGLQLVQGTAGTLLDLVLYFDYFNNSAWFLSVEASHHLQWGQVTLSNLWFFVPRALYHAKPYSYGQNLITDMLYPGASEAYGATPGLLSWSGIYWDFGLPGVLVLGYLTGALSQAAFQLFLRKQDHPSFLLFCQLGIIYGIYVFLNAPAPIFLAWMMFQWLIWGLSAPRLIFRNLEG